MARAVEPTLLEPLPWEKDLAAHVDEATWRDFVTTPLGEVIEKRFADDTVRGIVASDALVGTFGTLLDPSLEQNRCFLYRLIGRGTGEQLVPLGGMGALSDALARAAASAGAEIRVGAGVSAIRAGDERQRDRLRHRGRPGHRRGVVRALERGALGAAHPAGRARRPGDEARGRPAQDQPAARPAAPAQVRHRPGVAFAGTLHVGSAYSQLQTAYDEARQGRLPDDDPLRGVLPLAVRPVAARRRAARLADALHPHAADTGVGVRVRPARPPGRSRAPGDRGARRAPGRPDRVGRGARRARQPVPRGEDARRTSRPSSRYRAATPTTATWTGHGPTTGARLETPDQQWGVPTGLPRVFLAGAGARRGGVVSGVAGHNAAQAVLASRASGGRGGGRGGASSS